MASGSWENSRYDIQLTHQPAVLQSWVMASIPWTFTVSTDIFVKFPASRCIPSTWCWGISWHSFLEKALAGALDKAAGISNVSTAFVGMFRRAFEIQKSVGSKTCLKVRKHLLLGRSVSSLVILIFHHIPLQFEPYEIYESVRWRPWISKRSSVELQPHYGFLVRRVLFKPKWL